jgi:SHS2 domain-containing protein
LTRALTPDRRARQAGEDRHARRRRARSERHREAPEDALAGENVFRWIEHTAELELEVEAPSEPAVFVEALAAFAELVGDGSGPAVTYEIELEAEDHALLLVDWLGELIYLSEVEWFVPERLASLELGERTLRAAVEGHRGEPRPLVKGVTLHRLELRGDDKVGWHARVVLDV